MGTHAVDAATQSSFDTADHASEQHAGEISDAIDDVTPEDLEGETMRVADGAESDSFERSDRLALQIIPDPPQLNPIEEQREEQRLEPPPGSRLRDGELFHDPRQLTPDQAESLQELFDRGNLEPEQRDAVEQFLRDYRDKRDDLFPDHPNPYPNPYPHPIVPKVVI